VRDLAGVDVASYSSESRLDHAMAVLHTIAGEAADFIGDMLPDVARLVAKQRAQ